MVLLRNEEKPAAAQQERLKIVAVIGPLADAESDCERVGCD